MADAPINKGRITVQELKGLNERELNANKDIGEFDILRGCVPVNKNTLSKANGTKLLLNFDEAVLSICQTNDSRRNIIIQTPSAIRLVTEYELFGIVTTAPVLVPIASTEEESMSQAILIHQVALGTNGGTYTTANTWQQAPLSSIVSQLNPDGTAAAFCTLAANQFTLAVGVYRIRGYSILSNTTANRFIATRLYNITSAQPAWNGAANEISESQLTVASANERMFFGGTLNLAAPTIFEIQAIQNLAQVNSGFGFAYSMGKEVYRYLEILKTA